MTSNPDETTALVTCEADLPDEPHHKQPHTQDNDCVNPVAVDDEPKDDPPAEPLSVDDIPRTPREAKQRVVATIKRAKAIGPEPVKQAVGGLVDRFFTSIDNFFDRWEGKK